MIAAICVVVNPSAAFEVGLEALLLFRGVAGPDFVVVLEGEAGALVVLGDFGDFGDLGVVFGLLEAVDTFDVTEDDLARLGVDLREPAMF